MRVKVKDLIAELQQCDPESNVVFSGSQTSSGDRVERNHLARVDRFAGKVVVVIENGA